MKKLYLIDSHSLLHRAFHALPPLTSPTGAPSQALYGLASILLKIFREDKPEYMIAVFDRPEPTFRKEKYEAYKAQRPKAADELVSQLIAARDLFDAFGIKAFEQAGFEGDDLIASAVEKYKNEKDLQIVILTGDMDALQLVEGDHVVVRSLKKGMTDTIIYNKEGVIEKYGLLPNQVVDYKALMGDTSDNVKGVPGVGPKTASELLQKFKSIEGIFKASEKAVEGNKKAILIRSMKEEVLMSRFLVLLRRDVPAGFPKLDGIAVSFDPPLLQAYFETWGFSTLLNRLQNQTSGTRMAAKKVVAAKPTTGSLFGEATPKKEKVVLVAEGKGGVKKDMEPTIGFGLKEEMKARRERGEELPPPYVDLGVAYWVIDPDFKTYVPEAISREFLKWPWGGSDEDLAKVYEYAKKRLAEDKLEHVFYEIEMPVLSILADMERAGIRLNLKTLAALEKEIAKALQKLTARIYKVAGGEFNINSPQQVGEVLFDRLAIPMTTAGKTSSGQRSTRSEILELLSDKHPVVPLILEYRELFKMQSTYISSLPKHVGRDGRLHTEYVQTGAATGRLSSESPNLQNIPRESVWSPRIREAFEASPGYSLVAFDYSQIELRILAALSGDPELVAAFKKNVDIHALTASKVFHVDLGQVKPEARRTAKVLNFGLIYGMGARAFAKTSGFSMAEAKAYIEAYYKEFPKVKEFQEELKREARSQGFLTTLTGRRRYFPALASSAPHLVAAAEREALNHPLQGLDADINKLAMIKVADFLKQEKLWGDGARLLLTIHDELLFEIRDDMMSRIAPRIQELMEQAYDLAVPLRVSISVGKNWGNLMPFNK